MAVGSGTIGAMRIRFALAGMVVVAVVSGACSPAPSASPPGSPLPTPSASSTPIPSLVPSEGPTPAPTGQPASTILTDWTMHPLPIAIPGVYGGNLPSDLVRYRSGYVAVGGVNGGCCDGGFSKQTRALVWRSGDGETWHLIPNQAAFRYGRMSAVAVRGDLLVAVGFRNLDGIGAVGGAWTSTDGSTWRLVRDVPEFFDVAATASGFVAVANPAGGPQVWSSADGQSWRRIADDGLGAGRATRIIPLENEFLMVGIDVQTGHGEVSTHGVIWWSRDGTTWVRSPEQAAFAEMSIADAGKVGPRYVAIASSYDEEGGIVFTSTDGLAWMRIETPAFSGAQTTLDRAIVLSDTLVVAGWAPRLDGPWFRAWTSSDGQTWAEIPANEATSGGGVEIEGWVPTDEGFIAVGTSPREGEITGPAAWIVH